MEKSYIGSIVFFNNGKKLELPLSYSDLSKFNSKIKQSLFSKEEAKFLSNFLGTPIEEGTTFNAKLYKKLTEQGFSIIRIMPQIKGSAIVQDCKDLTVIISDKIKKNDADNLLEYYRGFEQSNKDLALKKQIYVFNKGEYYYNEMIERGKSPNIPLTLFLNYKTGRLSDSEAKIMSRYFNFNMQDVLLADTKDRPLSHKNEAVILITSKGKIYSSTKKKEQHKYEAIEMIEHKLGFTVKDREAEADKLAKEYNLVVIKLYKTDRNVAAIFCPEDPTEKQVEGLIKCMEDFGRINETLNIKGEPPILTLVDGNQFLKTDIGEYANVDSVLQKMIDYERNKKTKGLLGNSINWIATSVGSFSKYLEKLRRTLQNSTYDQPDGRE